MEHLGFFVLLWGLHAAAAGLLSIPVAFLGRKRVHWHAWELLALILPFAVWAILMWSDGSGKTLANLAEPLWFAFLFPVAALVRIMVGTRISERLTSGGLIGALCMVAAAVFFFVPGLPE